MQVTVAATSEDRAHVELAGELDAHTSVTARQELQRIVSEGPLHVTLDLRELAFIDSTGIGVLVNVLKNQRSRGGTLSLAEPPEGIRKVLRITGLDEVFDIV